MPTRLGTRWYSPKGSTALVMALLKAVGHPTRNNDLHLIAEAMKHEEIRAGVEQEPGCMAEVLTAGSQAAPAP